MRAFIFLLMLLSCWTGDRIQAASADSVQVTAVDTLWRKLQEAAERRFDGIEITLELGGGIERRAVQRLGGSEPRDLTTTTSPFGEAKIVVPLYSGQEKRKLAQEKGAFLEHGATMLGEFTELRARLQVKREEAATLKQALAESGLEGIREYYTILEEMETLKAKIQAATMKIHGWLAACGVK